MATDGKYEVTVSRVGDGLHDDPEMTFRTDTVELRTDGSLHFSQRSFGPSTWGSFEIVRVPSAALGKRRG